MNLLFINDKILDIDLITSNLLNTNYVLFNQATDTLDSLIQKIPSGNFSNVGILQDNPFTGKYRFLDSFGSSIVTDVATLDPQLASWNNFITLVNYLKTIGMTSLHFLQCNEVSVDWNYLKTKFLETQVSIEFSLNKTGLGGDWILESSNLNLVGLYFTEGILNYPHSLGIVTFGPGLDFRNSWLGNSNKTSVKIITKEKRLIFWGCNSKNNFSMINRPVNIEDDLFVVNNNYYFSPDTTTIVEAINQTDGVINVAGSEEVTIVVLKNGTVWGCGNTKWISTNYIGVNSFVQITGTERSPNYGINLDMGTINKISFSNGYTFYLNINGDVYSTTWQYAGTNETKERLGVNATSDVNGITKITGIPPIRDVQSSIYRTTFIDTNNILYICGNEKPDTWGAQTYSLGILNVTSVSAPRKLTTSAGLPFNVPIKSVSSGMLHSVALDMSGNIWVWGSLFQQTPPSVAYVVVPIATTPTKITSGTVFKQVSTGVNHIVAIDVSNNLWVSGKNDKGQLGTGNTDEIQILNLTKRDNLRLYNSSGNDVGPLIPHTIVYTGLSFTTIGYLDTNGDLLLATCGENGVSKQRDPYDATDFRLNFTKQVNANSPKLYNPYPFISSLSADLGRENDMITITGTGFIGLVADGFVSTSTVKFGSNPATITSITDTQIVVRVPPGTGTNIPVIVTNSDGDSQNNTYGHATFSYSNPILTPTITNVTVSNINRAYGYYDEIVIITGTNFDENSIVKFGTKIVNFTLNSITEIRTKIPNLKSGPQHITIQTNNLTSEAKLFVVSVYNTRLDLLTPNSGNKNTYVNITGQALNTVELVMFNDISANFTYNIDTSITATVPDLIPGSYSVTLKNPTITTSGLTFTVTPTPPPIISDIDKVDNKLIIKGTNFVDGNVVKIEGVQLEVDIFTPNQITTKVIKPININPVISNTPDTGFSGKCMVVNVGGINYKIPLMNDPDQP
jgi:alpha-tubulin suppressor-like RCC1 family protein